jgi:hypothetical protein
MFEYIDDNENWVFALFVSIVYGSMVPVAGLTVTSPNPSTILSMDEGLTEADGDGDGDDDGELLALGNGGNPP